MKENKPLFMELLEGKIVEVHIEKDGSICIYPKDKVPVKFGDVGIGYETYFIANKFIKEALQTSIKEFEEIFENKLNKLSEEVSNATKYEDNLGEEHQHTTISWKWVVNKISNTQEELKQHFKEIFGEVKNNGGNKLS